MDGGSYSRSAVALPPLSPLLSWKSMRGCDKAPPIQKKSRQAGFQDLTFWINNHSSIFKKETSGCAGEYWVQKRYLGKILYLWNFPSTLNTVKYYMYIINFSYTLKTSLSAPSFRFADTTMNRNSPVKSFIRVRFWFRALEGNKMVWTQSGRSVGSRLA